MTMVDTSALTKVEIVPFCAEHLPGALALSQAAGWPHRIEDWQLGLTVSQGVVGVAHGQVVATGLCSFHGPVATLNMIIVDAAMRGCGLGGRVMKAIMALAGDREMRLVATDAGFPLYRKQGFVPSGRILQLQGLARAERPERPVSAGPADIAILQKMDRDASGMDRAGLLSRIAEMGETLTTKGGFALLRPFGLGHVLGPVVADDKAAARALIAASATHLSGRFLRMDLPEDQGLAAYAEALGLSVAGSGTAMVHSPRPRPATGLQSYALISQALG